MTKPKLTAHLRRHWKLLMKSIKDPKDGGATIARAGAVVDTFRRLRELGCSFNVDSIKLAGRLERTLKDMDDVYLLLGECDI